MSDALKGKRILVVDDERDVCEAIADQLEMCEVDCAESYEAARARHSEQRYDAVILDIMGVRGYDLLADFSGSAPCIMLTAHALSRLDVQKAMAGNAVLYLPKAEIRNLDRYVERAIAAKEPLWSWLFAELELERFFGRGR